MSQELDALLAMSVPGSRGGRRKPLDMAVTRVMVDADVEMLEAKAEVNLPNNPLGSLRHSHHMLARLLAEGRAQQECSLITGYSPSRISLLAGHDPAFKELVEYYKGQKEAQYLDVHARLAALGLSSIDELHERLELEPERWSKKELMDLAVITLDRAGHGPQSVSKNSLAVTVKVQRFSQAEGLPVIEACAQAPGHAQAQGDAVPSTQLLDNILDLPSADD